MRAISLVETWAGRIDKAFCRPVACYFLLSIMLALASATTVSVSAQAQVSDAELQQAVVLIERPRGGGRPSEFGTGFFVSPAGHILTAAHVLLESEENDHVVAERAIKVRLKGRSDQIDARVLQVNRFLDLALIKIKPEAPTPFLPLGRSQDVKRGDPLIVVGHPLTLGEHRLWNVSAALVDSVTPQEHIFLQASLFEGQSGGPAVNDKGEVVGIVSHRANAARQSYLIQIDDAHILLAGLVGTTAPGTAQSAGGAATTSAASETGSWPFRNDFLSGRVISLRSEPQENVPHSKVLVAIELSNTTDKDIAIALKYGSTRGAQQDAQVVDDRGVTCLSYRVSGVGTAPFNGTPRSSMLTVLPPDLPATISFELRNCDGSPKGESFNFRSDWLAMIDGELKHFPVNFRNVAALK